MRQEGAPLEYGHWAIKLRRGWAELPILDRTAQILARTAQISGGDGQSYPSWAELPRSPCQGGVPKYPLQSRISADEIREKLALRSRSIKIDRFVKIHFVQIAQRELSNRSCTTDLTTCNLRHRERTVACSAMRPVAVHRCFPKTCLTTARGASCVTCSACIPSSASWGPDRPISAEDG